jgi:Zn-dependent protease
LFGNLLIPVISLLAVVLGISVHEFSHALSANALGDPTAKHRGRLTLNPVAHFDPIGAIMMLISSITGYGFGWGKPVPVNPANLQFGPRVGMAITSFAGPFSNIALATLLALPLRLVPTAIPPLLALALRVAVYVNAGLAVFNLLPIYPLDGFSILRGIVSTIRAGWAYRLGGWLDQMVSYGPMIFMGLLLLDYVLPAPGILGAILGVGRNLLVGLILGS